MTEFFEPSRSRPADDRQVAAAALHALTTVFTADEQQREQTLASLVVLRAVLADAGRDADAAAFAALADWVKAGHP